MQENLIEVQPVAAAEDGGESFNSALAQLSTIHTLEVSALQKENTLLKVQVGQLRSSLKKLHSTTWLEALVDNDPAFVEGVAEDPKPEPPRNSILQTPKAKTSCGEVDSVFPVDIRPSCPKRITFSSSSGASAQSPPGTPAHHRVSANAHFNGERQDDGSLHEVGPPRDSCATSRPLPRQSQQSRSSRAVKEIVSLVKNSVISSATKRGTNRWLKRNRRMGTVRKPPGPIEGTLLFQIVDSPLFDTLCAVVIILNSILIGWSVQYKSVHGKEELFMEYAGHACSGFYLMELILRMLAQGRYYFMSENRNWHFFDICLVVFSIVDLIITKNSESGGSSDIEAIKTIKMLRIVRVFRVFRFFRELSLLALMIVDSIRSLVWALIMLTVIIYVFAICFTQSATDYLSRNEGAAGYNEVKRLFGSLPATVYSLILSMLGGVSWHVVSDALLEIDFANALLFFFYITFTMLAVLNIITGVFVDNAVETASTQREFLVQKEMEIKEKYIKEMRRFFNEMDSDDSGTITLGEVKEYFEEPRVLAYFQALGLEPQDTERLFDLIDGDGSGEINVDEFLDGCLRLKGSARSIDVHAIMYECKRLEHRQEELMTVLKRVQGIADPAAVGRVTTNLFRGSGRLTRSSKERSTLRNASMSVASSRHTDSAVLPERNSNDLGQNPCQKASSCEKTGTNPPKIDFTEGADPAKINLTEGLEDTLGVRPEQGAASSSAPTTAAKEPGRGCTKPNSPEETTSPGESNTTEDTTSPVDTNSPGNSNDSGPQSNAVQPEGPKGTLVSASCEEPEYYSW